MNSFRILLFALGSLLLAVTQARAQYELKTGNFNTLWIAQTQTGSTATPSGPPVVVSPAPTLKQFSGIGQVAGVAGPIDTTPAVPNDGASISAVHADRYPSTPDNTIVLTRAAFGGVFASGVPRYFMGDIITPPLVDATGTPFTSVLPAGEAKDADLLTQAQLYWRMQPVQPGENITPLALPGYVTVNTSSTASVTVTVAIMPASLIAGSTFLGSTVSSIAGTTITLAGNANQTIANSAPTTVTYVPPLTNQTFLPLGSVNVTECSTSSTSVSVSSLPEALVRGATMLGQPVSNISGTTITLAGNADRNITSLTSVPITPAVPYYYSPHAEKVYASQPGRVTLTWVTRLVTATGGFEVKSEDFAVSSNTTAPVRTIFWTEGSFDGPRVQVTDGRISTVNPVFYSAVPKAVAQEVNIPGYTPLVQNLTTLSFDRIAGIGQLHAYNVEGRILVEYLGNVRLAGNIHESIGHDVVDLVRVPTASYPTVHLGKELTPHEPDPGRLLQASAVLSGAQSAAKYYGTTVRVDGSTAYFAERETSSPNDPDDGAPSSADAYNKVVLYWLETGTFGIKWPKFQDRYWQRWSPDLSDYAHYTTDPEGSTPATGLPFIGGSLPQLVYQDDPAQAEARIDLPTQRLVVAFAPGADTRNRSLLKFTSSGGNWYVNLYTQAQDRAATRVVDANGSRTVTLTGGATTAGLEVGMIVTGTGINGTASIVSILDRIHIELSQDVFTDTTYRFTVESDALIPINTTATVGTRLLPPAGHETGGYIDLKSGKGYYPEGYLDPFVVGVAAANQGAIIPVNALPSDKVLTVRWFKKISAPGSGFQDLYVPGKFGQYTVSYPATTTPQIVIAQGVGTDDLPPAEKAGSIYYQNNAMLPGYNPNEEHAFMLGGRAYALREDLNITGTDSYTSEPFVLVAYTNVTDKRPDMRAYKVLRTGFQNGTMFDFDYVSTAGTLLVKPYPLPLMPLPMVGTGADRTAKDIEITGADIPTNGTVAAEDSYKGFTFKDRKGFTWIHRGPHGFSLPATANGTAIVTVASSVGLATGMTVTGGGITATATILGINGTQLTLSQSLTGPSVVLTFTGSPAIKMKLYYLSRAGFFIPGMDEPDVGTVLPFLRASTRSGQLLNIHAIDNNQTDQPLEIVYRPTWPANAPELMVGETLTLPKFGLPQVRGQASARIHYQQSIAQAATASQLTKNSVTLHDPTREKTVEIDAPGIGLDKLPAAIKTTSYQGRTYFQSLPPHLQQRFWLDPLRGAKGTLVFTGVFHDEIAGEDYLDLNLLSTADETVVKGLVPDGSDKTKWEAAINGLKTSVRTYAADPARAGSYIVAGTQDVYAARNGDSTRNLLTAITDSDTAKDSYAISATGQGTGFVTMVFGDGKAFTPEGDPVQVKVFKIANQLYVGDLKVINSSNPLDEQVTLRHSGDFAGKPEDYEFEWRWATGEASAPATYATVITGRIGDPAATPTPTDKWFVVSDPGALLPTAAQYTDAGAAVIPGSRNVHPVVYKKDAQGQDTSTIIDTVMLTPSAVNGSTVTLSDTSNLRVGMTVTGSGFPGTATVTGISDATRVVLSLPPANVSALTFRALTYTDAEIEAGYPSLVAKSSTGVNFSTGVPGTIVFSADVGTHDGFVLYVNGKSALAFNAPTPQFTLTSASTGLTSGGLSKQFNIAPGYFSAALNTIEVALYTTADPNAVSTLNFVLEAAQEKDLVTSAGSTWQIPSDPTGKNTNFALVGGSTANPFGGPQFVLNDRWFTMRYKPTANAHNVLGTPWSRWMPPQFVEGWVKRVLAAINPFEQRVKDLYNNQVNTDVSVITQAGKKWEGDIALTMSNINDVGLIEIYETVLNRARSMTIDANTNDPDSNKALLLAAGYLNDLYTLLGNEAYADAANPTISIDDAVSSTEVNTSRFSFEGQVANSLEEELALLRGRDDIDSPGVTGSPAYNRLYWNYTRGINSGEALYAVNYNIKEKAGSATADGVVDESDAQRMFPQGHGDAYGHFLTALTGYYQLLTNSNFTWTPSAEAVTVLGKAVTVDFKDERKFAAAAGNVARTAEQIISLVHRQSYKDDPASGWSHFRDSTGLNTSTGVTRHQGLDEWSSRATQGAYYHWAVANALVPAEDTYHTGIQKIDRTTVPEISALATAAASFQTSVDSANAHLNPLGLSPGAITFDIEPYWITSLGQELADPELVGKSHFEQIYIRALRALNNASGAFNQAAVMTRSLRDQQNQLDDQNNVIVQQEITFVNQLIDIFGRPYAGDIGPGKLYAQGYSGPDLEHWFIVDRPNALVDTSLKFTIEILQSIGLKTMTTNPAAILIGFSIPAGAAVRASRTITIQPSQFVQYNDVWEPDGLGSRAETGELQNALQDAQQSYLALSSANIIFQTNLAHVQHLSLVLFDLLHSHVLQNKELSDSQEKAIKLERLVRDLEISAGVLDDVASAAKDMGDATAAFFPLVNGVDNDFTFAGRGAALWIGVAVAEAARATAIANRAAARAEQTNLFLEEQKLEKNLQDLGFKQEEVQLAYEYATLVRDTETDTAELMNLTIDHQRALENVRNVIARGNRILAERSVFRQRAAAVVQGYRTRDVTFRVFRNEALEQYRTLFDLASRYSYLAAKSYDYETGLLGSPQGQTVFSRIIASRALGDLTGGVPQSTVGSLGDDGLAGSMAKLKSDFSVAEGRLGLNNPDFYNTIFSLRRELFRLFYDPDPMVTKGDDAWKQVLEQHIVANVLMDSDVASYCRNIKKPDGTPVPGFVIPFSSTIQHGKNFFGLSLAAGDHAYTPSSFSTKISGAGIVLTGYVGMDSEDAPPDANDENALSATPYVYLIPCGTDHMLAPFGDTNTLRSWTVRDQALPLPYNLGASSFNTTQFFSANDTLSEEPWVIRKHQAFRPVSDRNLFYSDLPIIFTNPRLIGRSVWNGRWKIVIPAYTLLNNEQDGLNRFVASVKDIELFLRTYSNSGN